MTTTREKPHNFVKKAPIALLLHGTVVDVVHNSPSEGDALNCIWMRMAVESRSLLIGTSDFWPFF
jgi:hypothetical protein